jgi:hypothetical protein
MTRPRVRKAAEGKVVGEPSVIERDSSALKIQGRFEGIGSPRLVGLVTLERGGDVLAWASVPE